MSFGSGGNGEGWTTKRGFALFSILFPVALAAFMVFIGSVAQFKGELATTMKHLAAELIVFFSLLSWCIVRSNRRTPARIDFPSLLLSIAALTVFILLSIGSFAKLADQKNHLSVPDKNSRN